MKPLYEELTDKGLDAGRLTLELAWTIPLVYLTDFIIGSEIVTFKAVEINPN